MKACFALFLILAASAIAGCEGTKRKDNRAEILSRADPTPNFPTPGTTYLSFSRSHGFQVEHLASGGRAFLWYPGNTNVVVGEWKTEDRLICYRYGSNTYNPATGQRGGFWNCRSRDLSSRINTALLCGDPFGLIDGGKVPYVLQRCSAPPEFRFLRPARC